MVIGDSTLELPGQPDDVVKMATALTAAGVRGTAANDEGETSKRNTQEAMQSAAKDAEDLIRANLKNASPDAARGEPSQNEQPTQGCSDVGSCNQPGGCSTCPTGSRAGCGNCDEEAAAAALAAVQNVEENREKLSRLFSEDSPLWGEERAIKPGNPVEKEGQCCAACVLM